MLPDFFEFPPVKRRKVEDSFSGGDISSNGGIPLLSQVDRQLGITEALEKRLSDPRREAGCDHSLLELLRWCERHDVQYIVGLAKNDRLKAMAALWTAAAEHLYHLTGKKQRLLRGSSTGH